ncbi:MAG: hypothetical protein MO846_02315 [Candidatus Devosia symbiotica]|nr:hypothetical protein [Candidatus Devosia symbiotica]
MTVLRPHRLPQYGVDELFVPGALENGMFANMHFAPHAKSRQSDARTPGRQIAHVAARRYLVHVAATESQVKQRIGRLGGIALTMAAGSKIQPISPCPASTLRQISETLPINAAVLASSTRSTILSPSAARLTWPIPGRIISGFVMVAGDAI